VKWDVFISHAREDKESVALPLAQALTARGLRVWLDRQELLLGDSLRAKVDEGLAESRFGVVVLSEIFLNKQWPLWELNGLVAIERRGTPVILPVWHGLDHSALAKRSPMMADRIAANTAEGIGSVATMVADVVLAAPGAPSVGRPTVGRRLVALVDSGDVAAVGRFLEHRPAVMRRAFGHDSREVRRNVRFGDTTIDLCVGSFWTSTTAWRWRAVLLGPVDRLPFLLNGNESTDLTTAVGRVRAARAWVAEAGPAAHELLTDIRPGDFEAVVLMGRRADLGKEEEAALQQFNNMSSDIRVRTYDWLIDTAVEYA
jgi:hypothetical protein